MSKILWCIVGETSSGKDMIARYLKDKYGLLPVCSNTTRPPREGEVDGREHWFITDEEMEKILEEKEVVAYTKIEDKSSNVKGYEYCATLGDVCDADTYIIDPRGIRYMKEKFPNIEIKSIMVYASEEVRRERALGRDKTQEEAFNNRVKNERKQFAEFKDNKEYDYLIINEGKSIEDIFSEVDSIIKEWI